MAKAYRVKHDVSFPRVISRGESEDDYATEGSNYPAGSVIHHATMTPRDQRRAESGELDHLLDPMSDEEASDFEGFDGSQEPEVGIFIAEHEAEAHALEMGGHHVVPKEQHLELMSANEEHHREYQNRVKEAGIDRRPVQESLAQDRERIPDEILTGGQTPAGAPHNAGPAPRESEQQESDGDASSQEQGETRRRPPSSSENEEG